MFEACVDFGLSQPKIVEFSRSWKQPITTIQQVSDKILAMNLRTVFDKRKRKRIGPHNDAINDTFVKIMGQIMDQGWDIENIAREKAVFEGFGVQPDYYAEAVKLAKRLLLAFEVQASKTKYTLWGKKLRQYIDVYESGLKIRVYVMVHSLDEMIRARREARRILKATGHDGLNLFVFALFPEIKKDFGDVVTKPIWKSAWTDQKDWILLG